MSEQSMTTRIESLEREIELMRRNEAVVPSRIPVPGPVADMALVIVVPNQPGSGLDDDSEQIQCRELERPNPYEGAMRVGPVVTLDCWWPLTNARYQQYMYRYEPEPSDGDEIESGIALPVFELSGRPTVWIAPLFTFAQANAHDLFARYGQTSCFPTPSIV